MVVVVGRVVVVVGRVVVVVGRVVVVVARVVVVVTRGLVGISLQSGPVQPATLLFIPHGPCSSLRTNLERNTKQYQCSSWIVMYVYMCTT